MSRSAVLVTGSVAGLLVGRAALAYRGVDSLALGLVLLIGAGLAAGVAEGFLRATRAERLLREANALPEPATLESVDRASPPIRAFLQARIAGAPSIVTSAPFTPYLLGLLVMIGLLGTFLGLFETLRGAREALSASGDIASLRAGLTAPMTGLSRAFGTSATGVSASAMLGLGAVFVRRAEGRLAAVLGRYATTSLVPLTMAGRQLAALSALAQTSEALPAALVALRESTLLIERLSTQLAAAQERSGEALATAQREASAEATSAIRATAGDIRADIDRGIARAADAVTAAAQPLLTQTVAKVGEVAGGALAEVVGRLDRDALARRARDTEHLAALTALAREATTDVTKLAHDVTADVAKQVGAATTDLAKLAREATTDLAKDASAAFVATAADLHRREEARAEALHARLGLVAAATERLGAAQAAQGTTQALAEDARTAKLGEALAGAVRAIEGAESRAEAREAARMADAAARIEGLVDAFATQLESVSGRLADPLGRAAQAAEASVATAAKLVQGAQAQLGAEAREAAARGAKLDALVATLDTVAARIADDAATRTAQVEAMAKASDARTQAGAARAEERASRLAEAVERTVTALAERQGAYEAKLVAERGEVAAALSERLADHARGLDETLRATATTVSEASALLRSGGAEMVSVAEMFTAAVDRYREASDRWLENLGAIEDALAQKDGGEAAALLGSYVAQTREVFDTSLQFQRELFTELRALRAQASA
jgi:hypothetical protein